MKDMIAPITRLRRPKAPQTALTEARVKSAPTRANRYWISDAATAGLALRISPSGERSYYVRGRIGSGREAPTIDYCLGDPAGMRLAQARKEALAIVAKMKQGIDPRAPQVGDSRVSLLLDAYEAHLGRRQIVKAKDAMSSLRRSLHRHRHMAVSTLTRAVCVAEIEEIEASGRPGAAQDFRKHCSTFLNWCVAQGHLAASPLGGYRRPRQSRAERLARPRLTYTGAEALRRLWAACDAVSDPIFGALLRFGLLTGLRRHELAQLRWAHLDLGGDYPRIDLPAEITKTGEARSLPLGPLSIAVLREQTPVTGADLVFPGRRKAAISGWTKRLRPIKQALNAPGFGLHALRRSYRSGLSDLGVSEDVAEVMVGHKRRGLVGTYDHSEIWPARVEAQQRWERHVSTVFGGLPG